MEIKKRTNVGRLSLIVIAAVGLFIAAFGSSVFKATAEPAKLTYSTVWCSAPTNSCHLVEVGKYVGTYTLTKHRINRGESSKWTRGEMFSAPTRLVIEDGVMWDDTSPTE